MKQLAILTGAVVLLVSAWLIVRKHSGPGAAPDVAVTSETSSPPLESLSSSQLKDPEAVRTASRELLQASGNRPQAAECVGVMKSFTERLPDSAWELVGRDVLQAYQKLSSYPEVQAELGSFEEKLLGRFAHTSDPELLESLVKLSADSGRLGTRVSAILAGILKAPIGTFVKSTPARLIAAALRAGELAKAKDFLDSVHRTEGGPDSEGKLLEELSGNLSLARDAKSGKPDLAMVVRHWAAAKTGDLGKDPVLETAVRRVLVGIGVAAARAPEPGPDGPHFPDLLRLSANGPDAGIYWEAVARDLAAVKTDAPGGKTQLLAAFFAAYAKAFGVCRIDREIWTELAHLTEHKPKRQVHEKFQSIEWLRKALGASRTDDERLSTLRELKVAYEGVHELRTARRVLSEAMPSIENPEKREELAKVLRDLDDEESARAQKAVVQDRKMELGRLAGQLSYMQARLEEAKKAGRSPEDIRSMEAVIRDLEARVSAAQK